jgi:hypothetical protein
LVYAGVVAPVVPVVPPEPPLIDCVVPDESINNPPVAISKA